ncbi:MAG: DUF4267 domain-containing protein [Alphaproteobacteria bacterium]|nr:DUF4267 domain-containing protein [Alphaproteobacteria bacterium]
MKDSESPPGPPELNWYAAGTHVAWLSIFVGAVLMVIGLRFLIVPDGAAATFGLGRAAEGPYLHYVIGLRDLWLGGLAIAFAYLRDWRALFLWLAMGVAVCLSDASVVWAFGGPRAAIIFHCGAGVLCAGLAFGARRRWRNR